MDVNITMNGAQIVQELCAFKEDIAVRTVKNSTRRIGAALLKQLKANTPTLTGNILRNLGVRAKYVKSRGIVAAKVIVNTRGKKGDPKNAFYWRFVEFGHKSRSGGNVAGVEFVQNTFGAMQSQIQSMFYADLEKAIQRQKAKSSAK